MRQGLLLLAAHLGILGVLAGKAWWDRDHLPRLWVRTLPVDPNHPLRGRYVRLRIPVEAPRNGSAVLHIRDGKLVAEMLPEGDWSGVQVRVPPAWQEPSIAQSLAFFIPEHVPDPSVRPPGEELWVEVSVSPRGLPRPVRLGVKTQGTLTPLDFR